MAPTWLERSSPLGNAVWPKWPSEKRALAGVQTGADTPRVLGLGLRA